MILLECGIKKIQMILHIKTKTDSDVEDRLIVTSEKRKGGSNLEAWDDWQIQAAIPEINKQQVFSSMDGFREYCA